MKIISVTGTRHDFIKIAPLDAALRANPGIGHRLVHIGRHEDYQMAVAFFEDLPIPRPDLQCGVESNFGDADIEVIGTHFQAVCRFERPISVFTDPKRWVTSSS